MDNETTNGPNKFVENGMLAMRIGKDLPLEILKSHAGYYIGTSENGIPCSRESIEYFVSFPDAEQALKHGTWIQKPRP